MCKRYLGTQYKAVRLKCCLLFVEEGSEFPSSAKQLNKIMIDGESWLEFSCGRNFLWCYTTGKLPHVTH